METSVESIDGRLKKHFKDGEVVSLKVSELLDMTGISLDDRNRNSGGDEPIEHMDWPMYRMTGMKILL